MVCSLDAQEDGDQPTAAHCRQSVYRYPQGPIEEQHSIFFDCILDLLPSQSLSAVLNSPIVSEKATAVTHAPTQDQPPDTVPYSIFTRGEKRWIVFPVAYEQILLDSNEAQIEQVINSKFWRLNGCSADKNAQP